MPLFSKTLEYSCIKLDSPEKVLWLSFIVQKSICYLDLSLCRNACFPYDLLTSFGWEYFAFGHLRNVNSEEKCQKLFGTQRYLLYTLNLDLPKGREHSLKEDVPKSVTFRYYYTGPHVGQIIPVPAFYAKILSDFVPYAIESNMPKLRIFKWLVKMASSEEPFSGKPLTLNADRFFDCFYPEFTDVALLKDFIMHIPILDRVSEKVNPERLEFLLRHARQFGRKDLDEESVVVLLGYGLFHKRCFSNIGPVLKFISFPRFTSKDYRRYFYSLASISSDMFLEILNIEEIVRKRGRIKHMLQIIWMYFDWFHLQVTSVVRLKALRLLWSCFPDACISLNELFKAFGEVYTEELLREIYDFYSTAVGEFHNFNDPRSLQHLCKCALRSVFQENGIWIPDGVSRFVPTLIWPIFNLV